MKIKNDQKNINFVIRRSSPQTTQITFTMIKTVAEKIFDEFCHMNLKYVSRDLVVSDIILELIEVQNVVSKSLKQLLELNPESRYDELADNICQDQTNKIAVIVSIFPIKCIDDGNYSPLAMSYDTFNDQFNNDVYEHVCKFALLYLNKLELEQYDM